MPLCSVVHSWRKLRGSCQHPCAGASDALFAAVLLTCLRRLVGVELEDEPASRLSIDVDVEKGTRSVSGRHCGELSSI